MSPLLGAVIWLACALTFSAAQMSCQGRCGAEYYRGYMCQCDYSCLSYGECCKDYESQCTTKNSCKGRCGEDFKRGRLCSCDPDCVNYNQCCPDFKGHCDAEEAISGAASATVPAKASSCDSVNNNKPKEPSINEAKEASPFSEENNPEDNFIPLVSPTSNTPTDSGDDVSSPSLPDDDFSNNGQEGVSPVPESTSGYEFPTADQLDPLSADPTAEPDNLESGTQTITDFPHSDNEATQADDSTPTVSMATGEAPTESTDAGDPIRSTGPGTNPTQPATLAERVSSPPTDPASASLTEVPPTAYTQELQTVVQATVPPTDVASPEAQETDSTEASPDNPEVTTIPATTLASANTGQRQDYTVLDISQVTSIPDTSAPDWTLIPDTTASIPVPNDAEDTSDPSTSVSPATPDNLSEFGALTTRDDTTGDVTPQVTTAAAARVSPDVTKPTAKPQDTPSPTKPTPVKPETKPLDSTQTLSVDDPTNYQADDSNDTNLCSGRPVSGVTTLRNGTMVVFRGHYFWFLSRNGEPGPARGITQVWGVPSPIDTVFTRCNCQGKTYILRGSQYWRFENDALDPGYPKVTETGFDGLRGHITAALSVPQYKNRRESVYFFKRGGLVQKYSYQFGTSPTCGRKPQYAIYTVRNRMARQAVSLLNPAINIRTSWRGFPTTITAAVSIPNTREPEGYKYYVFSRSKSYNVRMDGERPIIADPKANSSPQSNNLIKC